MLFLGINIDDTNAGSLSIMHCGKYLIVQSTQVNVI